MNKCLNLNCSNLVKRKNNKYCSIMCSSKVIANDPNIKDKRKQTNLKRYGYTTSTQNKEIKEKTKQTNLNKYGCVSSAQNQDIKNKVKQTNIEKYGYESHNSSDIIKDKKKKVMLEKYGVENPLQDKFIMEKVKQTNLERYGVVYGLQNIDVRKKIKQTNLERYGFENPFQNKEILEKYKKTFAERYGVNSPLQNKEIQDKVKQSNLKNSYIKLKEKFKNVIEFLFTLEDYIGGKKKLYNFKCLKCNSIFDGSLANGLLPRCLVCYPIHVGISKIEKEVSDYLKSLNINIIERSRSIISPYELDIYLPDQDIGIEFNGLYWHSELQGKGKKYHLDKTDSCLEKNIQLIHIFEDEWIFKQDIVKSIIASKLGLCDKVYARKTIFREVVREVAAKFLEKNHLQGNFNNIQKYYGLYYNDELVQLIGIGQSRYNKSYDYELIRSCTLLNTTIVGGFDKLIKNLPLQGSLISYVDRRYFNGNGYKNWTLVGKTDPNYFYLLNNVLERQSRLKFQKHKLPKLFPDVYDSDLTEWEIMQLAGYDRIWDCGNIIFNKNT